jgi:hypothetical protein
VTTTDDPYAIEVGFGMDVTRFQQTRRVVEIQRFPGNDGSAETRGRDILLLGVRPPFEIDGQTNGYHRQVLPMGTDWLVAPHRCIGWDLRVSTMSPTSRLQETTLTAFTFDTGATNRGRPMGDRVWWLNANAEPEHGVLPMEADVGSACFYNYFDTVLQTTLHSGNPERRLDGSPNDGREAYAVALGDPEVRKWLDQVMFGTAFADIDMSGTPGVCSTAGDRLELFGRRSDGRMGWWTWNGSFEEHPSLAAPEGASLSNYSPGVYCTNARTIELFAVGTDGAVWWQTRDAQGRWNDRWDVLDGAVAVDSGIAVVGVIADHFHLFARGRTTGNLLSLEVERGRPPALTNLGGIIVGTPSARIAQQGRIDVFVLNIYNGVSQMWMNNGAWMPWAWILYDVGSEPAVTSWSHGRLDVLTRNAPGVLGHAEYQVGWAAPFSTDILMPVGTPVATSSRPGRIDLFVNQDGRIWHAWRPRAPR